MNQKSEQNKEINDKRKSRFTRNSALSRRNLEHARHLAGQYGVSIKWVDSRSRGRQERKGSLRARI